MMKFYFIYIYIPFVKLQFNLTGYYSSTTLLVLAFQIFFLQDLGLNVGYPD
jgi:hypothetical protein